MKILKLHFKNLNSLVGEWTIDFTAPEYSSQGIFAITGPTGAGKSTILDAICLALYGRTPRLERINANQNELMSRQSGECFASLEFRTSSGHYRTLWSQARARKKADGNLQNAQHIIEDCSNNKTLEDKLSKTAQVVTDVTGMDFEHFTRAMLLAQGGFAKFLHSSADERSPILEKITGTEIYSQISKLVHERKTSEENILNNINAQLAGIRLFNSEEIEDLQTELDELTNQITSFMAHKTTLEQQQTWLNDLQKLYSELATIEESQQKLQLQKDQFASTELRLKDAKLVEEINSDIYIQLQELRKQVASIKQNLHDNREQLQKVQVLVSTHETQVNQAANELSNYKITHAQNLKTLQQVRLLDAEITTKQTDLAKIITKLDTNNLELDNLRITQQELAKHQANKQLLQTQIGNYLIEHQMDANLVSSYSGICAELDNLLALDTTLSSIQSKQTSEEEKYARLIQLIAESEKKQSTQKIKQQELHQRVTELQQNIQQLANGKSIAILNSEILQLNSQASAYRELLKLLQDKSSITLKSEQINAALTNEQTAISKLQPQLQRDIKLLDYSKQLLDNLTAQQLLQSKMISLSDERANLQPNQPCPLCGGLDHPYAVDGVAVNNEIETQITQAKTKVTQLQATVTQLNAQLATSNANIAKLAEQQAELVSSQEQLQQHIANLAHKHDLSTNQISATSIQMQLDAITTQITQLNAQIKQMDADEKQLSDLNLQLQQLDKSLHEMSIATTRLAEQKLASEKEITELALKLSQTKDDYTKLANGITAKLVSYQISAITSDEIPNIKYHLAALRDAWQNNEQQATTIKEELQQLTHQLEQNSSLQKSLSIQISEQQAESASLRQSIGQLTTTRISLFADKNPDASEAFWQQELNTLEEKSKTTDGEFNRLIQKQSALHALIEKDCAQLQPLLENQNQREQQFIAQLKLVNIADEDEFISKRLSRDEIQDIQETADNLKQQAIELTSRHKQTSEILAQEQAKQLTDQTNDELQAEIANIQTTYEKYNQRIGEIRGQLSANQQALEQQQETINKRDKQLQITERYRRLHVLIGSSDGKKFRNFAQGLTFELVVKHANKQLQQMSDRYLLIRDNNAPLELNVIDNYQGGEIRTTKNLSGGESFVISLALALGLSKLSSNKVQVDSLFLDEGFGTLDEDSLQTALDALDSLQRDGKLIGVISHVGALKDRISLQIQVEPLSGGVSRISGVGCGGK